MQSHKLITSPATTTIPLKELHLSAKNKAKINQLLEEFTFLEALQKYQLPVAHKILLYGASGCGKTATANAIARELNKPIVTLHLGNFVSSKLGATAKNITDVFTSAQLKKAVLFIDEFDFIGKTRDYDQKDSGEMKRLVNVLLQLIDNLATDTLLICATNHIQAIDTALLRRFQLQLKFKAPTQKQLDAYYAHLIAKFPKELTTFKPIYNISYAEAKDLVFLNLKKNIILKEKQRKQFLFSYGTLQLEKVQLATYGRLLDGKDAVLPNYTLQQLQITDVSVLETSDQEFHPIAIKTNATEDTVSGKIFEITTAELLNTDAYEVDNYKRVLETFASGEQAWVYVKK
ncbi:AAA family ATPase [Tenacibaculum amylolyticum]|uniref:AAA family ATPase n=1 Tax=Tenacibaculum amylolyticum TaxID=104269 RepID=UPI003895A7AD